MSYILAIIYLALVLLRPQEFITVLDGTNLLAIVLFLSFIFWAISNNKLVKTPQLYMLIGLFISMMLSHAVNGWLGGSVNIFWKIIPSVLIFIILSSVVNTEKKFNQILTLLAAIMVYLVLHGIDQKENFIGWTGATLSQGTRITYLGIFNDPNDLAQLFVASLPFMYYMSKQHNNLILKYFYLFVFFFSLYGIYLTQSRGGLIAVSVVFMVFLYFTKGAKKTILFSMVFIVLLGYLSGRIIDIDPGEESAFERIEAWYAAIQMFKSHIVFGIGAGSFLDHYVRTAHNSFYLVLAETGIVGFFFWITMITQSLRSCFAVFSVKSDDVDDAEYKRSLPSKASFAVFLSIIGYIAASFFLSRSYNIFLFILCSFSVVVYQLETGNELIKKQSLEIKKNIIITLTLAALIYLTTLVLIRMGS